MLGTRRLTVAAFAGLAIAVIVILGLWVFPGYLVSPSSCPISTSVNGVAYCAETNRVVAPTATAEPCRIACSLVWPPTFYGATFWLHLTNGTDGPTLNAMVVDGNTSYHFVVWANVYGPQWLNWTSPNDAFLIQWRAPFLSQWPGAEPGANITCGVAYTWILTH
jgi:hypothetical protein